MCVCVCARVSVCRNYIVPTGTYVDQEGKERREKEKGGERGEKFVDAKDAEGLRESTEAREKKKRKRETGLPTLVPPT